MVDEVAAGSAELAALYPIPRIVAIAGREVTIEPPTLRRLAAYDQLAAALWALGDEFGTPDEVLFEEHPEAAADMLATVVDAEREWLVALPPLRKVELFAAWMEFNADFLSDRLRQQARLRLAAAAIHGAGPTPSLSSPGQESPILPAIPQKAVNSSKPPSSAPNGANASPA